MTFDSKQDDGEIFHQIGYQYHYLFECHLLKIEKKNKFLPNNLRIHLNIYIYWNLENQCNPIAIPSWKKSRYIIV